MFTQSKIREFYKRYENRISSLTLVFGFIFDSLTLRRVDILSDNIILIGYLLISGISIFVLNIAEHEDYGFIKEAETQSSKKYKFPLNVVVYVLRKIHLLSSVLIQFCFGGLFSAFLIFYSRSSSLEASWPFLLVIFLMLLANEVFKKQYIRVTVQMSVFFFCFFSFSIFFVPLIFHSIGASIFIASGVVSLVFMYLFFRVIIFFNKEQGTESYRPLIVSILSIFVIVNILYFTNSIPPLPLVMKKGGVYHSFEVTDKGDYRVMEEKQWTDLFKTTTLFHKVPGEPVYAVTAVYSPVSLDTDVIHNWQYYDEEKREWISTNKIKVPIVGGREGGYRLYSLKTSIFEGLWRVDVQTETGQIMGRIKFEIVDSFTKPKTHEVNYI